MVTGSLFKRYPIATKMTNTMVTLPNLMHRNLLAVPVAFLATELPSEWLSFSASISSATVLTHEVA